VLEANEHYWRKPPSVKTLRFRVIPDEGTRLAAAEAGPRSTSPTRSGCAGRRAEAHAGPYPQAGDHSRLVLAALRRQWDPKSPWADKRVRPAANLALDRQAINQAETLGFS
jgi:ABC-type transport system substrate-binding protein